MRLGSLTVIVTGGGSGIGSAIARRFAEEGASVVVVDVVGERAEEAAAEIRGNGGDALAFAADVTVAEDVARMVSATAEALGATDVLVNNVGYGNADALVEIDEAAWESELALNLKAPFLCAKAVLPAMIDQGSGVIVNIASVNAFSFFANEAYSAAKAGLISLTRSIAVRYGPFGIRANAIAPGTIRTPFWDKRVARDPEILERLAKWYPLGRVGEPEDVAGAAVFLASEDASWITGEVLRVDGGLLSGSRAVAKDFVPGSSLDDV